jgi:hypothetical protein
MPTNLELTELLSLEIGTAIINRRPTAKEVFKWLDIDLLPHSATDTLLAEIYEWNGRNWRSTGKNLIGYIFNSEEIQLIKNLLINTPRVNALIPDFEFTKEHILEIGAKIPGLYNINFTGKIESAKKLNIKVNKVTRSRLTNIDSPGMEILKALSIYSQSKSKNYRKNVKFNFLSRSLFYAESVEIELEKEAGVDIGISFDINLIDVDAQLDTETKKHYKLTYKNALSPFASNFVKGKDFVDL